MKIILDIPKYALCAFINYIYVEDGGMRMAVHSIPSEELTDGSEIKIDPAEKETQDDQTIGGDDDAV